MGKQSRKEAILRIQLVKEAKEMDSEVIKKDILRDSFIPWSKEIISVQVRIKLHAQILAALAFFLVYS